MQLQPSVGTHMLCSFYKAVGIRVSRLLAQALSQTVCFNPVLVSALVHPYHLAESVYGLMGLLADVFIFIVPGFGSKLMTLLVNVKISNVNI